MFLEKAGSSSSSSSSSKEKKALPKKPKMMTGTAYTLSGGAVAGSSMSPPAASSPLSPGMAHRKRRRGRTTAVFTSKEDVETKLVDALSGATTGHARVDKCLRLASRKAVAAQYDIAKATDRHAAALKGDFEMVDS